MADEFARPMKYTDKVFLVGPFSRTRGFYDELFREAIHDAEKQARAEVLAACLALMKPQWLHGGVKELQENQSVLVLRGEMEKLQPAAKDLEELLREERERYSTALSELVAALDRVHADSRYQSVWTLFQIRGGQYKGPTYEKELEQARAVGKG
jgi:hypothetical protein